MKMKDTECAICEIKDGFTILYKENLPANDKITNSFAPRRVRDYYHYRIVKCDNCGLVRSNPIFEQKELSEFYSKSTCSYTNEDENIPLNITYGNYLQKLLKECKPGLDSYLDIGTSNGFMLEKALELGFKKVAGIEPSTDAVSKSDPKIRDYITCGMFTKESFSNDVFDVVTFFQTFDHIAEPNQFLNNVYNILKPNGYVLAINHNFNSLSSKILKDKSPIIDIGHTYLYDLDTMKSIFSKNGFEDIITFPVKNIVTISRLIELSPITTSKKNSLKKIIRKLNFSQRMVTLYLGNLGIIARKASQ